MAIAWVVVRTRIPGRQILDAMSMLPLAVPGLVLAFGYFSMTREKQPFDFLILGEDPVIILVIAYAVRRLPYGCAPPRRATSRRVSAWRRPPKTSAARLSRP
ncbi:MAG: hypothetical protein R3F31_20755 [Verrucomicrobiales bacterium]